MTTIQDLRERNRRSRRAFVAVLAAAAVAVAAGVAYAGIPGDDGVIRACYAKRAGDLRVIDTALGQTCSSGERPLSWNQIGPQGPRGPAGPVDVFVIRSTEPFTATSSGTGSVLPRPFRLPAGNYVVNATVSATKTTDGATTLSCRLVDEPQSKSATVFDSRISTLAGLDASGPQWGHATLPLHATLVGGGELFIECSVTGMTSTARIDGVIITATKVETINEL